MREDDKMYPDPNAAEEDRRLQADPELSEGAATTAQKVFTTIAAIAVVVLVLYGLNHQRDESQETASAPAAQTTGAAPPAGPQDSNKSQGSGNAAPRDTTGAAAKPPADAPESGGGATDKQK